MHVIRLHGPWTAEITDRGPAESRRVHLPRDWSALGEMARSAGVVLVRRFHRPTGLDATTRVRLAIPAAWPVGGITINNESLGAGEIEGDLRRFDIARVVQTRESHDLRIELTAGEGLIKAAYFVGIEISDGVG